MAQKNARLIWKITDLVRVHINRTRLSVILPLISARVV